MPRDPKVVAIHGRHKLDRILMVLLVGDSPEGQEILARRNYADCAYERGIETASRLMVEAMADGTLTQDMCQALVEKMKRVADMGEDVEAPFE